MSFKETFCSSPWLHMRITNTGDFEYCRWKSKDVPEAVLGNIRDYGVEEYFQQRLTSIRAQLLNGEVLPGCADCHRMEQYGKISGRQKQLLKVGVRLEQFTETMRASPWMAEFDRGGETDQLPVDWQVDLGNFCNSACVFCSPRSSSRIASEYKRIGWISELPPANWVDDEAALNRFVAVLGKTRNLKYVHFIGGETLITPGFRRILSKLIEAGTTDVTIGLTTNLTVWDDEIVGLLSKFKNVQLGMSIECMDSVNDYVRWPSKIDSVKTILERWQELGRSLGWIMTLRITPTVLTVDRLVPVYQYAMVRGLSVESCNFLTEPKFMNPGVMSADYRGRVADRLQAWVDLQQVSGTANVNIRDPNNVAAQITADATSYVNFLRNEPNRSYLKPQLDAHLAGLDQSRNIRLLDYRPDYAELF